MVPGTLEPAPVERPDQLDALVAAAGEVGYPLLVKAAAGGGGRGMRRVTSAVELPAALAAGSHEAASAFGDGAVYLEREIRPARHLEVQLLGDATGRVIALGERDCSLQRRHQKLVEEAPAPGLSAAQRRELHEMAVRVASAAGLRNAATCEFLHDEAGRSWFLEVNTRLQVEHGVTELVAGVDIVREQLWLAAGASLSPEAEAAAVGAADPTSHAIEVRLSAEDPARDSRPTPGRVTHWVMPAGPGVRVDTAMEVGQRVPPDYDPLIAKLMVHATDRPAAIARLRRALDETEIGGIQTTLPFHRAIAHDPSFAAGAMTTDWVDAHWDGPAAGGGGRRARRGRPCRLRHVPVRRSEPIRRSDPVDRRDGHDHGRRPTRAATTAGVRRPLGGRPDWRPASTAGRPRDRPPEVKPVAEGQAGPPLDPARRPAGPPIDPERSGSRPDRRPGPTTTRR